MQSRIERLAVEPDSVVFVSGKANVFYYSGFTSEDAYLIIGENTRQIITDSRYFVQARQQAPDFDVVDISAGFKKIFSDIKEKQIMFEENNVTYSEYERLTRSAEGKCFVCAQKIIDFPRRQKDESELRLISEAEKIGDMAFSHILDYISVGKTEREIALELEIFMKKNGAEALSFETIAASGKRSSMPHGTATDKPIENGEFLTLDFGCVYKGYCSDMTRTVVVGTPDDRQKKIYDIVLAAQQRAINSMAVGMACSDIDSLARKVIEDAGYGKQFGHSLGHSVGVEIHEQPCFSPKSQDILCEGNVLSVEPGIYIDDVMGVRIEDLIAVRDGKIINLTSSPKDLIII